MIRLENNDYKNILPLTASVKYNKALIYSIIEGRTSAKVFVDDSNCPKAAFLAWEFSFLLGDESDKSFSRELFDYIFAVHVPESEDKEIILFEDNDNWTYLNNLFKEKGCLAIERKMFCFNRKKYEKSKSDFPKPPEYLKMELIDENRHKNNSNYNYMTNNRKNFRYIIKDGDKAVSTCASVAVAANEAEIDISTDENYRNKGYATIAASHFIERCIENNLEPVWSCWPEREGSVALAKKLGFEENENVPVILWAENM